MRIPLLLLALLLVAPPAGATLSFDPFGPGGEGGLVNGQRFSFGTDGRVFELDAFLAVDGLDLNPGDPAVAAQLSLDPLPAGLDYAFSAALSPDASDLLLAYEFTNATGAALGPVTFLSFVDAEIGASFSDEFAVELGTLAPGQRFEVDEPGFVFGDVFEHLELGMLDGTNAVPPSAPEDVSMALSFSVAGLAPGEKLRAEIQLSDDGDGIGSFALLQADAAELAQLLTDPTAVNQQLFATICATSTGFSNLDPSLCEPVPPPGGAVPVLTNALTYSGRAEVSPAVPEPGAAAVFGLGLAAAAVARRRARGTVSGRCGLRRP